MDSMDFKQLYNDGLAKLIEMPVNWCEGLGCVLSNDEVIDGKKVKEVASLLLEKYEAMGIRHS